MHGKPKAGIGAYIAFIVAVIMFSGVFQKNPAGWEWLSAFDFSTLIGKFGSVASMAAGKATTFVGKGYMGARGGFVFGLSLVPGVMFAAQVLLTPLLKPILGLPGLTGLALITDLQSTDAGAGLTKGLMDSGLINQKQLVTMCAWQYAGAGCISNFMTTVVGGLLTWFLVPIWVPMVVFLILKFVGAFLVRMMLSTVYKKDFQNE